MEENIKELDPKLKEKVKKNVLFIGILTIIMLFAGFTSAYVVMMKDAFWVKLRLPDAFWISTVIIIISSLTIHLALKAAKKGNQKGKDTLYDINRSSYALNIIAVIIQKLREPKNKGKTRSHIIRTWVKTEDFKNFYNLMRHEEKLTWSRDNVEKYVKQINDLWSKPNQLKWKKYFNMTGGYFILVKGSGIGKRSISNKLFKMKK